MALGDLMTSRLPQTPIVVAAAVVSSHFNDCDSLRDDADVDLRRESEETASSSCNNENATMTATSMAYLPQTVVMCENRHHHDSSEARVPAGASDKGLVSKWRLKDRMKTGSVALVLCLNIGVDPPDVIKISPCARMECWIDPFSMAPTKALETIGKTLNTQYERWQTRAKYRVQLDPTVDEIKKLCSTSRKYAKSERVLFHYNGHGVPKPTANGEIWLFNKSYTEYIPLPISDLDSWLMTPSIYVFDCSAAGLIIKSFIELHDFAGSSSGSSRDCILLAACEAHETLPQSAEFPADVFTSCLTTPIKMALRWFCSRSLLNESLDPSLIDKIPGRQNDRKTLLGELNWIFTAVTDTIAWNVLPHDLFQRLFRQDLLVASLFRNFLLAERIMRSANCSPISHPHLPSTHQHHMWDAWDMAAEMCLSQLPMLIEDPHTEFESSPFFSEQLTAFEVWLDHGSGLKKPPEQLPIVLQVLLSQSHRFRALVLLGRFLDMGPWAVDLALSVGIFPYVLKLLPTTTPELRQILVFIWTKILAFDKSCQVDIVKDGGHIYFIRFLDSMEAYPEQRAMAAFVLAVIVDGHRRGQEACIEAGLIHVCLKHLQGSTPIDSQTEPLFLQWLCLCLGKLWEDFIEAQIFGLQANAPAICSPLLSESQPEVRASAVFTLGTLLGVGSGSCRDNDGGDDEYDEDEKIRAEVRIIKSLLTVISDGSPLVRAEVAVALGRFAFGHNKHLKSVAAKYWKPQSNSLLTSLPTLVTVKGPGSASSQIGSLLKVSNDNPLVRNGRVSTSSPLASSGIMHESPLSDDLSHHSVMEILDDGGSNGQCKPRDNGTYYQCVLAMCTLAKDPSPLIVKIGRRVLAIIGIEQVVAKPVKSTGTSSQPGEFIAGSQNPSLAGLARSSSWLDMNGGHLPFCTPPVSPPKANYLTGIRRVYSLEFRPHLMSPDSGLADPLISCVGTSGASERSFLPQSTIYNWSCCHFSKPLLTAADDSKETLSRREERENFAMEHIAKCRHSSVIKLNNQIASWDTRFETGTKTILLEPFSPIVIASDENERIRVWNYQEAKEAVLLNSFDNHDFPDKGISKLCFVNELDDSLLLAASSDGNVRIWKDYSVKGKQKLVTAFASIQGHKPSAGNLNVVVDWQQQSGYLYASGELSSIMLWDLDREQLVSSIHSQSECSISVLAASQVHDSQLAAGFVDGSVRLYDVRSPNMPVCEMRPHAQKLNRVVGNTQKIERGVGNTRKVERVVGIGFQPGLDPSKTVSACQAGDIQFLDIRNSRDPYLTIEAHRGSLTALAVHRHAPIVASGSAKQLIKVFSLEGEQLGTIRYYPSFMAQKIGPVSCLNFHPYEALLAAGAADSCASIYADENS